MEKMLESGHRLRLAHRELAGINTAKLEVNTLNATGRRLKWEWEQAVPVKYWDQARPGEPLPGIEHRGMEDVECEVQEVVYVRKPGARVFHYDIDM